MSVNFWLYLLVVSVAIVIIAVAFKISRSKEDDGLADVSSAIAGEDATTIIDEASDVTEEQWNAPTRKPIKERRQESRPRKRTME